MIGRTIGNYRVVEKLGEGGMGAVYRAVDQLVDRDVALKVLRPEVASRTETHDRFRAEAKALAKLNHPAIAMLYALLHEGDEYIMVMEYVPGQTLAHVLQRTGRIGWPQAAATVVRVLDGVAHAHAQGIVHRDLKPANIMLTVDGRVKVTDFGIARVFLEPRLTRETRVVGTLEYMAPERIRGEDGDGRADIYSLGLVLYEMLSGRLPFAAGSDFELMRAHVEELPRPLRELGVEVPVHVEQAVMAALAKDPADRHTDAAAFAAQLRLGSETAEPLHAFVPQPAAGDGAVPKETVLAPLPGALKGTVLAPLPRPVGDGAVPKETVLAPLPGAPKETVLAPLPPEGWAGAGPKETVLAAPRPTRLALVLQQTMQGSRSRALMAGGVLALALVIGVSGLVWYRGSGATPSISTQSVTAGGTPTANSTEPPPVPPPIPSTGGPVVTVLPSPGPPSPVPPSPVLDRQVPAPVTRVPVKSLYDVRTVYVAEMALNLDAKIRQAFVAEFNGRLRLAKSADTADAVLSGTVQDDKGAPVLDALGRFIGVKGSKRAVLTLRNSAGGLKLWTATVDDRRAMLSRSDDVTRLASRALKKLHDDLH